VFAASLRAVQHLLPVLSPSLAPCHVSPTGIAGLARQALLVTFETWFDWHEEVLPLGMHQPFKLTLATKGLASKFGA
jgi:hypothetical protein